MSVRQPRFRPPLRVVLLAVYLAQIIVSGPMIARMAIGQAAAAGQQIVICTPEGLKTLDWTDRPGETVPKQDRCACPCSGFCGPGTKLAAGYGSASPISYPVWRGLPHGSRSQGSTGLQIDLSAGSSRSPPSCSIS